MPTHPPQFLAPLLLHSSSPLPLAPLLLHSSSRLPLAPLLCLTQDYYNLVDVYLDAVFFPRCISDRRVFEQEGWHLELDEKEGDMTFKGVVFNEMKGVYSSPDSVFYRALQQALFPDNTYRCVRNCAVGCYSQESACLQAQSHLACRSAEPFLIICVLGLCT